MFKTFKHAVEAKLAAFLTNPDRVVRMDITKEELWETYLGSFLEGDNPHYRERTEHDCNTCKSFIRRIGNIGFLTEDGSVDTIWNIELPGKYQPVADALDAMVSRAPVRTIFRESEPVAGGKEHIVTYEDGTHVTFDHFYVKLPEPFYSRTGAARECGEAKSTFDVLFRAYNEIRPAAIDMVIDLCEQNSLYRGEEHLEKVKKFQAAQRAYNKLHSLRQKHLKAWADSIYLHVSVSKIRSSVIGTLLVDLSEDEELETAVRRYEEKVAPHNYQRPKALVTKKMIARAEKAVEELGYMDSLARRHAVTEDITVNNVLFVDRSVKQHMKNAFQQLADETAEKRPSRKALDKIEEITAEKFVENVLPTAETVEVFVENKHIQNMFTLLAPVDPDAPNMLKWDNNFTWSYSGEVTDSIKQRVKAAGGSVTGDFRASLAWYNSDDLDLHLNFPGGHIYYGSRRYYQHLGELDVDMNAGQSGPSFNASEPVENITFEDRNRMPEGIYELKVHQYNRRNSGSARFNVEIEFEGAKWEFEKSGALTAGKYIDVAKFRYTRAKGIEMLSNLPESRQSREVWGINTEQFRKVRMVMNSPNHWDGNKVGNRHLFFVLEGCHKDTDTRGFYNEFLTPELHDHRKVFEMLGSRMKAAVAEEQLSGVGFSSTQRNHVLVRVNGSFQRTVKVTF